MRTKPFQCILCFLALLGKTHGSIAPTSECTARAWVRAPDLTPNAIVHGDARVKISAECPAVETVSLGLRFKERSFVKALRSREDVKWLNPERPRHDHLSASPWTLPSRFVNKSVEKAYEETITNKDLWIIREEERVVFETMQTINIGNRDYGVLRDAVHDFSIIVPSTNFPPALDVMTPKLPSSMQHEIGHVEWIYEYFTQISFSNGTTKEISAGFTAFQPAYDPTRAPQGLTSATVGLKPFSFDNIRESTVNYSIEISADSGLTFVAGAKSQVITAIITRTGFARTFSEPLKVFSCVISDLSPKWVSEYDMSDFHLEYVHTPASVLRATSNGGEPRSSMWRPHCPHQGNLAVSVIMPNSTSDEIEANEIVTTTSSPFTTSIDVADVHIPNFETYYQTLANSLTITLETPRGENEDVDPDEPHGERDFGWGPQFEVGEDDEEAWVPWEIKTPTSGMPRIKTWRAYSGRVAAVVHPTREGTSSSHCLRANTGMLGQVVLSDETGCEQRPLIHYLDEGARGPTFVDHDAIHELSSMGPAERELRAPILEPVVSSPPEGEERSYRYHYSNTRKPPIYVGMTWAKKVANKN